jgi:hypothetical protein
MMLTRYYQIERAGDLPLALAWPVGEVPAPRLACASKDSAEMAGRAFYPLSAALSL